MQILLSIWNYIQLECSIHPHTAYDSPALTKYCLFPAEANVTEPIQEAGAEQVLWVTTGGDRHPKCTARSVCAEISAQSPQAMIM